MLIIGKPYHVDDYIEVSDDVSMILHFNGFAPKYKYDGKYYFKKTDDLIKFMTSKNNIERRI